MATINRIKVPADVNVKVVEGRVSVSGPKGTIEREMRFPGVDIKCSGTECTVSTDSEKKNLIAITG
ncbi:MAG TPA: 50S ribosomal protein L6, partial [Methanomicrobiales archaeon]|nr:50S ribosomal protein L6 [Methanomicrobiales archaeon]